MVINSFDNMPSILRDLLIIINAGSAEFLSGATVCVSKEIILNAPKQKKKKRLLTFIYTPCHDNSLKLFLFITH